LHWTYAFTREEGKTGLRVRSTEAPVSIDRLSTTGLPASQRLAFWKDIFADAERGVAIEAEPDAFQGAFTKLTAGEFEITSVKSTPLISRSRARICSEERRFSLQLVHSGQCRMLHAGTEIIIETGDMIVVDAEKPYELMFKRPVQGLVLSLPWARFSEYAEVLEALAGRPINLNGGPAAVLSGFVRSAWDHLAERSDGEEWPQSASEVIWDLLTSILQDDCAAQVGGTRTDDLRQRAAALVNHKLFDPEFRSLAMAEELGVSARYLQRVFAEAGTTPACFLLARRLDAAAARLRHANSPGRITDIALECGFSDLSYFSRAFRRRFGVTARAYRLRPGAALGDWR
jgi:AraC-like DNA-binding protein